MNHEGGNINETNMNEQVKPKEEKAVELTLDPALATEPLPNPYRTVTEGGQDSAEAAKGREAAKDIEAAKDTEAGEDEEIDREAEKRAKDAEAEQKIEQALQKLKESVTEDDPRPSPALTLKKILGGDILNASLVRSQVWLFVLIVAFTVVYVAIRYQCQQDIITIDKKEQELKDAKYRALSCSSRLTERCRESRVLDMLRANKDSLIHVADQPPYIINVGEEEE